MKKHLWRVTLVTLLLQLTGLAGQLGWYASRAQAVEAALNSGKLILLLGGRDSCGTCQYMKTTVCETPDVRQVIDANYIRWYCPVDLSTEWYPYAGGLGSFTLPLMCVIDPGNAIACLDRSTATQSPAAFKDRLISHLPTQPLVLGLERTTVSRLTWQTEAQLKYRVLKSEDLIHWTLTGSIVIGDGLQAEFADPSVSNRCFYRLMGFR